MKIAVAGAHGVGKTTFARTLAGKLDCNYIHDIVREEAVDKGFVINERTPPEVQLWLVCRQWELEKTTPEDWVADKSLLDYLVYAGIVLKDESTRRVIRGVVERNTPYDFIFYLPIEFPLERDGVRSDDPDFQKQVDLRYKRVLEELEKEYIPLSGSVEERVSQAREYIKT